MHLSRTDTLANFFKGCGYFRDIAGKTKNRAAGGYRRKNSYLDNRLFDGDVARFERRGSPSISKRPSAGVDSLAIGVECLLRVIQNV